MVSAGICVGIDRGRVCTILEASAGRRFPPGVGVPGRAFRDGPLWDSDIRVTAQHLPGGRDVPWVGSAFAFPILAGSSPAGVLELFCEHSTLPESEYMELARVIGMQLGRVVERAASAQAEAAHRLAMDAGIARQTQQLVAARTAADAAERARAAFLASLSHDLRTPLHAMLAALDEAEREFSPDWLAAAREHGQQLLVSFDRLMFLADQAGGTPGDPRYIRLSALVGPTVEVYRAGIEERGGSFTVEYDPTAAEQVLIGTTRLLDVLNGLLARVALTRSRANARLAIVMQCDLAVLTFIHDSQAAAQRSIELVANSIESAAGELAIRALPGGGEELTIRLPTYRPALARRGSGAVLLVDDTAVTRKLGAAMISRLGHTVEVAESGEAALARLSAGGIGLVFMDLRMPGIDGLTATRRIRTGAVGEEHSLIPIVALTAHAGRGVREQALMAGMDDYLTKPYRGAALEAVIKRFLR
ncbi:MAG: response regulator [Candidatus Nanopelagicales bacterium]